MWRILLLRRNAFHDVFCRLGLGGSTLKYVKLPHCLSTAILFCFKSTVVKNPEPHGLVLDGHHIHVLHHRFCGRGLFNRTSLYNGKSSWVRKVPRRSFILRTLYISCFPLVALGQMSAAYRVIVYMAYYADSLGCKMTIFLALVARIDALNLPDVRRVGR